MNLDFFRVGVALILVYIPISFFLGILFEMIPLLIAAFGIVISVTYILNALEEIGKQKADNTRSGRNQVGFKIVGIKETKKFLVGIVKINETIPKINK